MSEFVSEDISPFRDLFRLVSGVFVDILTGLSRFERKTTLVMTDKLIQVLLLHTVWNKSLTQGLKWLCAVPVAKMKKKIKK